MELHSTVEIDELPSARVRHSHHVQRFEVAVYPTISVLRLRLTDIFRELGSVEVEVIATSVAYQVTEGAAEKAENLLTQGEVYPLLQ